MAFLYIHAFSLPFSCNYFTIFFLKQINGALGELVTTGFPHSFYPITHLLRKFLPYGLCWFILLIIIIHSPLSPPLWGLSHQEASFPVRLNSVHASLNFYEINSVYVSLNVILPIGSCLMISLSISSYIILVKFEGSEVWTLNYYVCPLHKEEMVLYFIFLNKWQLYFQMFTSLL